MLAWSEKFESGQSVVSAFRLFRGSVLSWVLAEGLMDVLKGESIPVGLPDVDLSRLRSYFGEESSKVTQAVVTIHRKNHRTTRTRDDFCRGLTARSVEGI